MSVDSDSDAETPTRVPYDAVVDAVDGGWALRVSRGLWTYASFIIRFFRVLFNVLIILVSCRQKLRKKTISLSLVVIAVVDTVTPT